MKKFFFLFLASFATISLSAQTSGICGDSLTWTLQGGVLSIVGTGEMNNWDASFLPTWTLYKSSIDTVIIDEGVTSIGDYAFYECSHICSISIPNSVTYIGKSAFYNCSSLSSVSIPNGNTNILRNTFSGCSNLVSIAIPGSVTYIDEEAFYECNNLDSVHITDVTAWCGITMKDKYSNPLRYAHHLYKNGIEITNIVIPSNIVKIKDWAFLGCSGLESVSFPNGLQTIGMEAFYGCSGLSSITIPQSVTLIKNRAFTSCSGLTSIVVQPGNTRYDSRNNCNAIIDNYLSSKSIYRLIVGCQNTVIPNSISMIGDYAFMDCSKLVSITIPNSVTSIGTQAFENCSSLSSITIPNSVTSIGTQAFENCSNLTNISLPNSITRIEFDAFRNCKNLTTLIIPNSVVFIGAHAFADCRNLTNVSIPNSVDTIDIFAFTNCISINSLTVPNSVKCIGVDAFENISNINYIGNATGSPWGARNVNCFVEGIFVYENSSKTKLLTCSMVAEGEINIPNSVVSIGDNAFWNCNQISSIHIPNTIRNIGMGCFCGCEGISSFSIPDGIDIIGNNTFYGCTGLTSINLPNSIKSVGKGAFRKCSNLLSITIPDSVMTIGNYAFANCGRLDSVLISNSVVTIGDYAFAKCGRLNSLYIPSSVNSLGVGAFNKCDSLKTIICLGATPATIEGYLITDRGLCFTSNPHIIVPCGSLTQYKRTWGYQTWGKNITYTPLEFKLQTYAENGSIQVPQSICDEMVITAVGDTGYHFVMWSDNVTDNPRAITLIKDTTFSAFFDINIYTVTFVDWNKLLLSSQQVQHGDSAVAPSDPRREGYKFVGWDKDFSSIKSDMTITAQYEAISGIENVDDCSVPQKVVNNGQLFILYNGEIYTVIGIKVINQ